MIDFNEVSLESKETSNGRFYKSPETGLWYPSVTTVTGFAKKDFFAKWRKDPVNQKEMTRAANRGTQFHTMTERYLKKESDISRGIEPSNQIIFEAAKSSIDKISNIVVQENSLWSDYLRLAGRVDCIGEYDGILSVIDFKGSTKPKKEEWITNYFEQATAYSIMFQERTKVPVKQIVILISCEGGEVQEFKRKTIDYVKSLKTTIDNYWGSVNFNKIQEDLINV